MFTFLAQESVRVPGPIVRTSWMRGPRPPEGALIRLGDGVHIVRSRGRIAGAGVSRLPVEAARPTLLQLLRVAAAFPEWHRRAACRREPSASFFGNENAILPAHRRAPRGTSRRLCQSCPVRAECLRWALTQPEEYGIWGGTSGERRVLLRKRLAAGESLDAIVAEVLDGPPR